MSQIMPAKDPDAVIDYGWDWTDWLAANDDDTISDADVTVEAGLTKDDQSFSTTGVTVTVSGGTAGVDYEATCHITTAAGREDDRTIVIPVRER